MDIRRLISWLALTTEILHFTLVVLSHQSKGEPLLLQNLHGQTPQNEAPGLSVNLHDDEKAVTNDDASLSGWAWWIDREYDVITNQRQERDVMMTNETDVTTNGNVDPKQQATTYRDVHATTEDLPQTADTTDSVASQKTSAPTTRQTTITTTTTTTTTTTPPITTTTTTISDTTTTSAPETRTPTSTQDGVACPEMDTLQRYFGDYGLIAFSVTLGLVVILVWILLMVICVPRCLKRKKSKFQKNRVENVSDMRAHGAIYRPRPSLHKNTPCVPTPLAMITPDDITSAISNKESRVLMTTDLDATSDPDLDGFTNVALESPTDKKFPSSDRKFSTISTADPTKVSTFLLRQASIKAEVEEKRKNSVTDSMV